MRRYDNAFENLEKALVLAPHDAEVNASFGQLLNYWGDPERGLQMMEQAFGIDTLVSPTWDFYAGHSHLIMRKYDQALTRFERSIELAPRVSVINFWVAWAYVEMDRLDDARGAIKSLLDDSPHYLLKEVARIYPYRFDEHRNRFLDSLRKIGRASCRERV